MPRAKKTHCLYGHEIAVVGREFSGQCKGCRAEYLRLYRRNNLETLRVRWREWKRENRKAIAALLLCVSIPYSALGSEGTWILEIQWPRIGLQTSPATTYKSCQAGAAAALEGKLFEARIGEVGQKVPATLARCIPGNQFPKGWDCIQNFNCQR